MPPGSWRRDRASISARGHASARLPSPAWPAPCPGVRVQAFPDAAVAPQYRSVLSTARHIQATEGAAGFFAGLLPRAFRICGAGALPAPAAPGRLAGNCFCALAACLGRSGLGAPALAQRALSGKVVVGSIGCPA